MFLQTLLDFFEGYFLWQFLCGLLEERFQKRYRSGLSFVALYIVLPYIKKWFLPADYGVFDNVENLFITFLYLLFLVLCFYKKSGVISIFLIVSFMAVQKICRIVMLLFPYLMDIWIAFLEPYIQGKTGMLWMVNGIWTLAYAARMWLMYGSLKNIQDRFYKRPCNIYPEELRFLLIPAFSSLSISVLINLLLFRTGEDGTQEFLFDHYISLRVFVPVMLFLSLLSILYGIKLFQDMMLLHWERSNRIVLEKQLKGMQEYIEETKRMQSGIRGIRHDMKNTIAVITQLISKESQEEDKELIQYLSELQQTIKKLEYRFQTGNMVVDALLNIKYHEAMLAVPNLKIDVCDLCFPGVLKIESYDIGVIIGNALDNAIEACTKQKMIKEEAQVFIKLSSFLRRNMFFLKVENSFYGTLTEKKWSEFPISDKKDAKQHGMGLINIKNVVEKYDGAVKWEVREQTFLLTMMLKNL